MNDNIFAPPSSNISDRPPRVGRAGIGVTDGMVQVLEKTRPWVKFVAIMGLVFSWIIILVGLGFVFFGARIFKDQGAYNLGVSLGMATIYLFLGLVYMIPSRKLLHLAKAIARVEADTVSGIEETIECQKAFWKTAGITILVGIGLYIIMIFVAILASVLIGLKG